MRQWNVEKLLMCLAIVGIFVGLVMVISGWNDYENPEQTATEMFWSRFDETEDKWVGVSTSDLDELLVLVREAEMQEVDSAKLENLRSARRLLRDVRNSRGFNTNSE